MARTCLRLRHASRRARPLARSVLDLNLFRRLAAKLQVELELARGASTADIGALYEQLLTHATGFAYHAESFPADFDTNFATADYLRAAICAAQIRTYLRAKVGEDWWRRDETGSFLGTQFRRGTEPSCDELATQLGFAPYDVGPLVAEFRS